MNESVGFYEKLGQKNIEDLGMCNEMNSKVKDKVVNILLGKESIKIFHEVSYDELDLLDGMNEGDKIVFLKNRELEYRSTDISLSEIQENEFETNNILHLDKAIQINIGKYIENKKNNEGLDCFGFVLFLLGEKDTSLMNGNLGFISGFNIDNLQKGDIVGFGYKKKYGSGREEFNACHYALYLGNGTYLSKLGTGYDNVCVMNENELKKMYKSRDIGKFSLLNE